MRVNTPIQLGPWGINESLQLSKQYSKPVVQPQKQIQKTFLLPKLPQLPIEKKQFPKSVRQTQSKLLKSLKMRPIQIALSNRLSWRTNSSENKKQRIAYDPPMISLHNTKHPKLKRKLDCKEIVNQSMGSHEMEDNSHESNLNRINLLQGYLRSSQGYSALRYKNQIKKQQILPRKRSLTQILKYLTSNNSGQTISPKKSSSFNIQNEQKEFTRYTQNLQYTIKSVIKKKQNY